MFKVNLRVLVAVIALVSCANSANLAADLVVKNDTGKSIRIGQLEGGVLGSGVMMGVEEVGGGKSMSVRYGTGILILGDSSTDFMSMRAASREAASSAGG